jgi:hypothetical protein
VVVQLTVEYGVVQGEFVICEGVILGSQIFPVVVGVLAHETLLVAGVVE